jgi:hypothetical protein
MARFVVSPHMRLQEWVADANGYFRDEGLDYVLAEQDAIARMSVKSAVELPKDQVRGAYQTIEDGRACDVSGACHWTVNMAAAAGHGRLWRDAYSVSPAGIFVPADSPVRRPEDLASVPVTVGYQSGSHYATLQALEPILPRHRIRLHFGGMLMQRLELLADREVPAAVLFNGPMYAAEQLGFRKVLDCTFISAMVVADHVDTQDLARYYRALKRAQQDLDLRFERYTHFYSKHLPARVHDLVDVRRFGPGERIVFLPYTKEMFEATQRWIEQSAIFEGAWPATRPYEESTLQAVT